MLSLPRLERGLTVAVLGILLLAAFQTLIANPTVTREEAIEISRNTPIVQQILRDDLKYGGITKVTADYWNATFVRTLKEKYLTKYKVLPKEYENFPDDHGVWRVFWNIFPPGDHILHFIDGQTGRILYGSLFHAG